MLANIYILLLNIDGRFSLSTNHFMIHATQLLCKVCGGKNIDLSFSVYWSLYVFVTRVDGWVSTDWVWARPGLGQAMRGMAHLAGKRPNSCVPNSMKLDGLDTAR